ncbi:MAG: hypothetical protein ACTSU2_17470 [Promethearchaeota archaeon]
MSKLMGALEIEGEKNILAESNIDVYKYSCEVVMNDPSDFDVVEPDGECRYYLNKAVHFF